MNFGFLFYRTVKELVLYTDVRNVSYGYCWKCVFDINYNIGEKAHQECTEELA